MTTPNETPTPKTDAQMRQNCSVPAFAHFARQLERELTAAQEQIAEANDKIEVLGGFSFCETCNNPLSQCSEPDVNGEPMLDCKVCQLQERLAEANAKLAKETIRCQHHIHLQLDAEEECVDLTAKLAAIQKYLSQPNGVPFFDGTLLEQVVESRREVEQENRELESKLAVVKAERVKLQQECIDYAIKELSLEAQRDFYQAANNMEAKEAMRLANELDKITCIQKELEK